MALDRSRFEVSGMTCGSCVRHVEQALLGVPGVSRATVDLAAGMAEVAYDAALVTPSVLQEAVSSAGYGLKEALGDGPPENLLYASGRRIPGWPLAAGMVAAAALTSLYVAIVGLAQGLDHALELMAGDWYFVIPIVVGGGVQVGLFVYGRKRLRLRRGTGTTKALAGAGTGASTVSMVACCAHHVTDVLPVLGISGAALFLNEYRVPIMALGIITNAIGIALMVRRIRGSTHCGMARSEAVASVAVSSP